MVVMHQQPMALTSVSIAPIALPYFRQSLSRLPIWQFSRLMSFRCFRPIFLLSRLIDQFLFFWTEMDFRRSARSWRSCCLQLALEEFSVLSLAVALWILEGGSWKAGLFLLALSINFINQRFRIFLKFDMNERIRKKILDYEATVRKLPETFGLFRNPEKKLELLWHLKNGTLFNVPETITELAATAHDPKMERQNQQRNHHRKTQFKVSKQFSKTIQTSAEESLNPQDEKSFAHRSVNTDKKAKSKLVIPKQLGPHSSKLKRQINQLKCCSTYQKNPADDTAVSDKINLSNGALTNVKQRSYNLKKIGRPLRKSNENASMDSGQKLGKQAQPRGSVPFEEKGERNREDSYIPWFLVGKIMVA